MYSFNTGVRGRNVVKCHGVFKERYTQLFSFKDIQTHVIVLSPVVNGVDGSVELCEELEIISQTVQSSTYFYHGRVVSNHHKKEKRAKFCTLWNTIMDRSPR